MTMEVQQQQQQQQQQLSNSNPNLDLELIDNLSSPPKEENGERVKTEERPLDHELVDNISSPPNEQNESITKELPEDEKVAPNKKTTTINEKEDVVLEKMDPPMPEWSKVAEELKRYKKMIIDGEKDYKDQTKKRVTQIVDLIITYLRPSVEVFSQETVSIILESSKRTLEVFRLLHESKMTGIALYEEFLKETGRPFSIDFENDKKKRVIVNFMDKWITKAESTMASQAAIEATSAILEYTKSFLGPMRIGNLFNVDYFRQLFDDLTDQISKSMPGHPIDKHALVELFNAIQIKMYMNIPADSSSPGYEETKNQITKEAIDIMSNTCFCLYWNVDDFTKEDLVGVCVDCIEKNSFPLNCPHRDPQAKPLARQLPSDSFVVFIKVVESLLETIPKQRLFAQKIWMNKFNSLSDTISKILDKYVILRRPNHDMVVRRAFLCALTIMDAASLDKAIQKVFESTENNNKNPQGETWEKMKIPDRLHSILILPPNVICRLNQFTDFVI